MNLLITCTSYPPALGGVQIHSHEVAKRLARTDDVQVVTQWTSHRTDWLLGTTIHAPTTPWSYVLDGVSVHRLGLSHLDRTRILPAVLSYYIAKRRAIGTIAGRLRPSLLPFTQEIDLLHTARMGREPLLFASLSAARQRDIPFLLVPYHHPRWGGNHYRYYHDLYRQADALIALTNAEKEILVRLGAKEDRVFVTGVGPVLAPTHDATRARDRYSLGDQNIILFLGQKFRYKGISLMLRAAKLLWARHPDAIFLFAGPRTGYSRRLFMKHRDPRILELGTVTLQDKTDLLSASTLLCVPSSQESFCGVITEAWALGKPVVARDIPATREVISDGGDGFLVDANPRTLADRLSCLLEDSSLREAMGHHGSQKVARRHNWARVASETRSAYRATLSEGK